jgi:hypothetical protein
MSFLSLSLTNIKKGSDQFNITLGAPEGIPLEAVMILLSLIPRESIDGKRD